MDASAIDAKSKTDLRDEPSPSVRALIENNLVSCAYQPIVNVQRGEIIGYEALLRPDPASGFANPGELFEAAEQQNLTIGLEKLSRETILQRASDWPDGTMLFMNCNPETAAEAGFASALIRQIERVGTVPHENIIVEVTERAETSNMDVLLEQLRTIRAAGVQIAIDDLGTGTSGLQRIMQLRPQWLKIDRELITGIANDPYRKNLVDVLVRFTRVSGVRLVAEGIETYEDLAAVMDMGVQHVQGFLLGRPESALQELSEESREWMINHRVRLEQKKRGPNTAFLSGIMREPFRLGNKTTIGRARELYWTAQGPSGAVLTDEGGNSVGWVSCESLLSVQFDNCPELAVESLKENMPSVVEPSLLISEALLILASGAGGKSCQPFIVELDGAIVGEVSVPDLLREAARLTGDLDGYYAQLSGLPSRVQCDRQLSGLIQQHQRLDALFIDIMGFHEYNEHFGYEVGDLILRILAGTVTNHVADQTRGEFVGHLGDDHFLLITFDGEPERIARAIIEEFEQATERFVMCGLISKDEKLINQLRNRAALRVILIKEVAQKVNSARELHRMALSLFGSTNVEHVGHSVLIDADRQEPKSNLKLSA